MQRIEIVKAGVGIELIEVDEERVYLNILPTVAKVELFSCHRYFLPVCFEIDGHSHHGIITNIVLVS